jgi:hypothetical protein
MGMTITTYGINIVDKFSRRNGSSVSFSFLRVDIPRIELKGAESSSQTRRILKFDASVLHPKSKSYPPD